jgi:peptide-methionine (R)-S-oxide reductase
MSLTNTFMLMRLAITCIFTLSLFACKPSTSQTPAAAASNSSTAPVDTIAKITRTEAEWKAILTPEQYHILREKGTDRPYAGPLTFNHEKGTYYCAACGNPLFTSDMKFDSECGWPSFEKELAGDRIKTTVDRSYGMVRTEITCAKCGSHLGHLFDDGPTLTGKRYCVNSTSLTFKKEAAKEK